MTDQIFREDLLDKLREFARIENRPVDAVLESMIEQYSPQPVPAAPDSEDDDPVFQAQYREFRRKVYQIAREYWQSVGDTERLALTDAQLDEQFWLIDHKGIPRLKSEEGTIDLPPDPLEAIMGIFDDDITDMSTTVRKTMHKYYQEKYDRPD